MRRSLIVLALALAACNSDNPGGPGDDAVLVAGRQSYDFGEIAVGQQTSTVVLTFTNTGDGASAPLSVFIEGPSADELLVSSDDCEGRELGPEEACDMTVALRPSFNGVKEVLVRVAGGPEASASTTIRGTAGGATMSASPDGLEFGDVRLSGSSPARGILVRNASPRPTGPLSVEINGTHASDFVVMLDACVGASLAGGFSCGISIRFQPSAVGDRTAALRVVGNDGIAISAPLRGTGGTPTFLAMTPSQHAFGLVRVSQGTATTFTVRNDGPGSSGVLVTQITGVNANNFRFDSNGCAGQTLAVGATCVISTRFQPVSIGSKTAEMSVSSVYAEAVRASLSGDGAVLSMAASPQTMAFSTIALSTSAAQTITVTNTGNVESAPLRTALVDVSDYYYYYYYTPEPAQFEMVADACASVTLAPGASCSVSIRYAPRAIGSHAGRFMLFGDASQSASHMVEISGTAGGVRSTVSALDFPPTLVGTSSAAFTVGIFNTASTPTGTLTTSMSPSGNVFTIVSDDCAGAVLAGGGACTISVRFSPASQTLHHTQITVDGIPGGAVSASLRGQGM